MKKLIELLNENKNIDDYLINNKKVSSYQMFFVHEKLETSRATDSEQTLVTIYKDGENCKGETSFHVYPYMNEDDIRAKIDECAKRASLVKNQPYKIVEGGSYKKEMPSNMNDIKPCDLASSIADAIFSSDCLSHGSLNAVEVFVYRTCERIVNSKGVDKTQLSHRAMIEVIPTWTENGNSVELYESFTFTEFSKEVIVEEINRKMREVRDRQIAKKPEVPFDCDILFPTNEIPEILNEFCDELNYLTVYSHGNVHQKGDDIQKDSVGDKLNISMVSTIKGSPYSAYFDDDGADLVDTKIIENGIVKNYYGGNRSSQYLGEKCTGELVCINLEKGSLSKEQLSKANYIEVVSMSGIQVDLYNNYIGGEIRLAYYHKDGKVIPVTGISISATLSDALKDIRLSENVTCRGYYQGPENILVKGFKVI